jgi:hypothetical protein
MCKIAADFGVGVGTVQRVKAELEAARMEEAVATQRNALR